TLSDPNLDDGDRQLLSDVERHGCHVVVITAEHGTPGWAFSVGLFHNFQHPEVVVFGLSLELNGEVIQGIGAEIRAGRSLEVDGQYADILEGVKCTFRPVATRWYEPFFGYARWFYRGDEFPML